MAGRADRSIRRRSAWWCATCWSRISRTSSIPRIRPSWKELDDIEEGKEKWTDLLKGFYDHFEEELKVAEKKMESIKAMEIRTDEKCELCGSPLVLKWGKFGTFFSL
jgi:hypothetical protein